MSHPSKVFDHAMVLNMRDSTLAEIGALFGVTRQRIQQIEKAYGVVRGRNEITVGDTGTCRRVVQRLDGGKMDAECLRCGTVSRLKTRRAALECFCCAARGRPPTMAVAKGDKFDDWEVQEDAVGAARKPLCLCKPCGTAKPVLVADLVYRRSKGCHTCSGARRSANKRNAKKEN